MKAIFINPNLVVQSNDPFTTGIVYMPVGLASVVAAVRESGFEVAVIDAFGECPKQCRKQGKFIVLGLTEEEVISRIPKDCAVIFVFANQIINHICIVSLLSAIKRQWPTVPVGILENSQAVTAYALKAVAGEFFSRGADFLLTGEGELTAIELCKRVAAGQTDRFGEIEGILEPSESPGTAEITKKSLPANAAAFDLKRHGKNRRAFIGNLDLIPFPAWDLFPLQRYWSLRFAHGPQSSERYLPILTSRGCPYPCGFCVVPATNDTTWRARSATNVVDEIEHWNRTLGISEFHIEDLNPTVDDQRTRMICQEILRRKLKVTWKIVAGTKVETLKSEETIGLMGRAGCKYISISPETGSARVLKLMNKPFNLDHAQRMINSMNKARIHSQACFVLGFPGETSADRELTWALAKRLTQGGLDEIALFIITPVPGAQIFRNYGGYKSLSDLNFTPVWRDDYHELRKFRLKLYAAFLWWKIRYHPLNVFAQLWSFLTKRFQTKMEMVPYKALVWKLVELRSPN